MDGDRVDPRSGEYPVVWRGHAGHSPLASSGGSIARGRALRAGPAVSARTVARRSVGLPAHHPAKPDGPQRTTRGERGYAPTRRECRSDRHHCGRDRDGNCAYASGVCTRPTPAHARITETLGGAAAALLACPLRADRVNGWLPGASGRPRQRTGRRCVGCARRLRSGRRDSLGTSATLRALCSTSRRTMFQHRETPAPTCSVVNSPPTSSKIRTARRAHAASPAPRGEASWPEPLQGRTTRSASAASNRRRSADRAAGSTAPPGGRRRTSYLAGAPHHARSRRALAPAAAARDAGRRRVVRPKSRTVGRSAPSSRLLRRDGQRLRA